MLPLLIITGPTASGKTALAVALAQALGGEVISGDSMQVYSDMQIGTARPTEDEMGGVVHHLLGIIPSTENYSLERFVSAAHTAIADIHARGHLPILAGGTGLYVDTVADNLRLGDGTFNEETRIALQKRLEHEGAATLYAELAKIDPAAAEKLHISDEKRILRALEIYALTGVTKSEHDARSKKTEKIYDYLKFAIELPREILYNRINRRTDAMMAAGLLEEVRILHMQLRGKNTTAMQGVGYKELAWYLDGRTTYAEAVALIKRNTRRLAKRQLTWLRRDKNVVWLDGTAGQDALLRACIELVKDRGIWA